MKRGFQLSAAAVMAALPLGLAACGNSGVQPPAGYTDWLPAETVSSSSGFTPDATGDLYLAALSVTSGEEGTRVDLGTEGSGVLGWHLQYAFDVADAPTHYSLDLSGFTSPYPWFFTTVANGDVSVSTGLSSDRLAGASIWIDTPVDYRYHATERNLSLEFAHAADRASYVMPVPSDPEPEPWEELPFLEPSQPASSPASAAATGVVKRMSISDDQLLVGFEGAPTAWVAEYVDASGNPCGANCSAAALLLTVENVQGPQEVLDGLNLTNDSLDAAMSHDGSTLEVWIELPGTVPFKVSHEEDRIVVVLDN